MYTVRKYKKFKNRIKEAIISQHSQSLKNNGELIFKNFPVQFFKKLKAI